MYNELYSIANLYSIKFTIFLMDGRQHSLAIVLIFTWVHDYLMWNILLKSSSHFDSCPNAVEHYDRKVFTE